MTSFMHRLKDRDLPYILLYVLLVHVFFYKLFIPGQMLFGTDTTNQSYPMQVMAMREIFRNHSLPLWNPYIFGGMPLLASFSFHILYPGSWIFFFMSTEFATGYLYVLHFCLMGIFFFYYAKDLGLSRQAAFVGGLLLTFNLHCISLVYPGHGGKVITVTYLPLAMMLLDRAFRSRPAYHLTLLGLVVGLMFYGGHPQIMFYCGIAMSLFFTMRLLQEARRNGLAGSAKMVGLYATAFVLGMLLYAAILFPAWEYKGYTHRAGGAAGAANYEFATSFSPPPEDMLYFFLRNPFGWGKDYGPTVPTTKDEFYRGRMGLKLNIDYFSIFGLVLASIGLVFVRNRYTYFYAGLAMLSVFLALGGFNPYYVYVYKYIPGFSMFRVPYAILIIFPLCGTTMAAFGMQYLLDAEDAVKKKGLLYFIAGGTALTVAAVALAAYGSRNSAGVTEWFLGFRWVREMLWEQYDDAVQRFLFLVRNLQLFAICLAVSMVMLIAYRKGLLRAKYLTVAVSLFIIIDLWPVGWDFVLTVPVTSVDRLYFRETPQIKVLEDDKGGPFRVYSLVTNNELLFRGIQGLTGYHPVLLSYVERALDRIDFENQMLDLLNAKYLMLPREPIYDFQHYPVEQVRQRLMAKYEPIETGQDIFFYRDRSPLPRAYLVSQVWRAVDQEETLGLISDPAFKPRQSAVVAEDIVPGTYLDAAADLSRQRVEVTKYSPDKIEFRVSSPSDLFMVVSEIWYPGWKAYVDGRETKIYRTDYLLRGLAMPAGEHTVVMEFTPRIFRLGVAVSVATLLLFAGVLLWPAYRRRAGK